MSSGASSAPPAVTHSLQRPVRTLCARTATVTFSGACQLTPSRSNVRGARIAGVTTGPEPAARAPSGTPCEKSLARGAAAAVAGRPSTAAPTAKTPDRRRTWVATPIPVRGLRSSGPLEPCRVARDVARGRAHVRGPAGAGLPARARVESPPVDDHEHMARVGVDRQVLAGPRLAEALEARRGAGRGEQACVVQRVGHRPGAVVARIGERAVPAAEAVGRRRDPVGAGDDRRQLARGQAPGARAAEVRALEQRRRAADAELAP